jgi:TP901 family phage tail tape measure protein
MSSKTESRRINLYINGKEVQNDMKSIRNEFFKLQNAQSKMTLGSKEYNAAASEMKKLQGIINNHNKAIGRGASAWGNFKNIMMGVVGGNMLSQFFQNALQFIPNLVSSMGKLSDKMADVAKTTGMTMQEVKEFSRSLKAIDTRSGRKELLDLARIAGKLGYTGKKEIYEFVKATDMINVALSQDLGGNAEEAIRQIAKLVDVFKLKDFLGTEAALIKTGSALNALGMASTANEGFIVEFTKRVAGVAPLANISIQNIMGLAATLDSLGQTSEVSSTVFSALVPKMFKDTATFAEIAKMSLEDFTDLLNKDANEAFIKVLSNLNGNNEGLFKLSEVLGDIGLEGKRTISVLGVLSNNVETLRIQQQLSNDEFEKGTSLQEEFNVKNTNMAANLEKLSKWVAGKWMNSGLMTFLENAADSAADYVRVRLSDTMENERIKVNALAVELTNATTTLERRNDIYNELKDIAPEVIRNIEIENISITDLTSNLRYYNQEQIKKIALQDSEETLEDKRKAAGKAAMNRIEAELQVTKDLIKEKDKMMKYDKARGSQMEQILFSNLSLLEKEAAMNKIGAEWEKENHGAAWQMKLQLTANYNNMLLQEAAAVKEVEDALKSYTERYNILFEDQSKFIGPPVPGPMPSGSGGGSPSVKPAKPGKAPKTYDPSKIGSDEIAYIIDLNKQKAEAYKSGREQIVLDLQKSYETESNIREIAFNEELAALGTNEEAKKQLTANFRQEEIKIQIEHLRKLIAASEEIINSGGVDGLSLENAMLTDEEKDSLISKIEELKLKVSELKAETAGFNMDGEKTDPFGMTEDDWDKLMSHVQDAMQIADSIGQIWYSVNERIANQENANFAKYEKDSEKKKALLDRRLKSGLISEDRYNREVAAIALELDNKKKKIEADQAKRANQLATFSILSNTAMAVMNALATTQPFIVGVVMAALAAAAGIAQLAALPKPPEYSEGGYTKGDKIYRAGEKGKEFIAPNWMLEHPYTGPVIEGLNRVRTGEAPVSLFRSPKVPEYSRNSTSGSTDYNSTSTNHNGLDRLIEQNDELLKFFRDPENRKSYIRYDDLTKVSKEIDSMHALSGF